MEETKQKTFKSAAIVGIKLLVICALVAGIVSFVYALTKEKYQENLKAVKDEAIGAIFTEDSLTFQEGTDGITEVQRGGNVVGYCVELTTKGYGGDITMMVGFDAELKVLGVRIISHSETPGLGAKIENADFTDQFVGKLGASAEKLEVGKDIDAIGGATYSSRYVTDGVNTAREKILNLANGGWNVE